MCVLFKGDMRVVFLFLALVVAQDPFQYKNVGLPSDALLTGDVHFVCQLLELDRIEPTLYLRNVSEQSRYADMVMRDYVHDEEWVNKMIASGTGSFAQWQACSVGNVAYGALHAPTKEQRLFFSRALKDYVQWKQEKVRISSWWDALLKAQFPAPAKYNIEVHLYCDFMYWKRRLLG